MKLKSIVTVLIALAATGAFAQQKMYKSVMPDGRVVYSEKPEPTAKKVDTVDAPPAKSGVTLVTPDERARAENMKREQAASQNNTLDDARKQLKQAEAAREAAKEQKEGDRQGTAKGGSRLTEDYLTRQKVADDAVAKAKARVDQLERGR